MLDFRLLTFLNLCEIRNYTKTAEKLCITQPAVTQHIKYLENHYGGKLFYYKDKALHLTQKGEYLYQKATTMNSDSIKIVQDISSISNEQAVLCFGATLTIAEYLAPTIISKLITSYNTKVNMKAKNTHELLKSLENGEIEFALIEGYFDKAKYESHLLSKQSFIAVCGEKFAKQNYNLTPNYLHEKNIILREQGSGTRDVFMQYLKLNSLNLTSFKSVNEISSMGAILQIIKNVNAITFVYEIAVKNALQQNQISKINLQGMPMQKEFNFVFLKNSIHKNEYLKSFNIFKEILNEK